MGEVTAIRQAFEESARVLQAFRDDLDGLERLDDLASAVADLFQKRGRVLICGNGGSHCDALHFAEELTGRFRKDRKPLGAICLGDAAHITCTANDYGFDEIFARGVQALGQEGDILIGLSTSGNSSNVIRAVEEAKSLGVRSALFLGKGGGALRGQGEWEWMAEGETSDRIQEVHMAALHILIEAVERRLFPEHYSR